MRLPRILVLIICGLAVVTLKPDEEEDASFAICSLTPGNTECTGLDLYFR